MTYIYETEPKFRSNFKRLTKKNWVLAERIAVKIKDICEHPERGEPLSGDLSGMWSVHVAKHYVIIYEIVHNKKHIILSNIDHHDYAYGKKL
ncbi:MAG TPA: type II toxin-antitoxin system mRNA interferase toxin, RelE/StbE family [Methanotrichaceae archaeon]|nr:type II toxin-antitoxin system mRNA interferase toxin, RelE/StbE family [Methanotrichaceae archaeon]